jgi:TRAP-type C4-dicarboxylate transport system permease large subunit
MVQGGIMDKLIGLANAAIGRVRGGLAHVTVVSAAGLSAMSGTAVSDATHSLRPSARRSRALRARSARSGSRQPGPIIPPSAAMIVYAYMAGPTVSVGGLFIAGFVPGFIMAGAMMLLIAWFARRRGYPLTGERVSLRNVFLQVKRSLLIVLMPIVVVGGIVRGRSPRPRARRS